MLAVHCSEILLEGVREGRQQRHFGRMEDLPKSFPTAGLLIWKNGPGLWKNGRRSKASKSFHDGEAVVISARKAFEKE